MALTVDQVQRLAPDAAAAAAGKKLGAVAPWRLLGRSDRAFWGECQGSAVYQVQVDATDLAAKCSCPSRKLPCKHALGLLFLQATQPSAVAPSAEPAWVADWLARRSASAEAKASRAAPKVVSPEARAERIEKRSARIDAGIVLLDRWLGDVLRSGLVSIEAHPEVWEEQARRLVDAQAPGLASRIRRLGDVSLTRGDGPERLLSDLGLAALLSHAFLRLDALPPSLAFDVRQLVGMPLDQDEVATHGEVVTDTWAVVGQTVDGESALQVQRSWLLGAEHRRFALVLQFSAGSASFAEAIAPGSCFSGELQFWPSAWPQRAQIRSRSNAAEIASLKGVASIAEALDARANALAQQPWLEAFPVVLEDVVPVVMAEERVGLVDAAGTIVPLLARDPWSLLALSGGAPVTVTGELAERALRPLAVMYEGRLVLLEGQRHG